MAFIHRARNPGLWLPKRQPVGVHEMTPALPAISFQARSQRNHGVASTGLIVRGDSAMPPRVIGQAGVCWDFSDGVNSNAPTTPRTFYSQTNTTNLRSTIEAVISIRPNGFSQWFGGFSNQSFGRGGSYGRILGVHADGRLFYYTYDGGLKTTFSRAAVPTGEPLHIIAVSSTNRIEIYVNGVSQGALGTANAGEWTNPNYAVVGHGNTPYHTPGQCCSQIYYMNWFFDALNLSEIALRGASPWRFLQPAG